MNKLKNISKIVCLLILPLSFYISDRTSASNKVATTASKKPAAASSATNSASRASAAAADSNKKLTSNAKGKIKW